MKKPVEIKKFLKYSISFTAYFFLTFSSENFLPVSVPLLFANVYVGFNPIISFLLCFLPFLLSFSLPTICVSLWATAIISIVCGIYVKLGKKPKFAILFTALAVLPYAFFTDYYTFPVRLALCAALTPLPYVFISAAKVFMIKGLKYKLSTDEILSASLLYSLVGYGMVNTFGAIVWKEFCIFFILLSSAVAPYGYGVYLSPVSAIPLALHSFSLTPIAVFTIYALVAAVFSKYSKLLTGLSFLGTEFLLFYLTDALGFTDVYYALAILIPVCLFLFMPSAKFKKITNSLKVYRNPVLGRYASNRARSVLSNKLFEISSTFKEMSASLRELESKGDGEEEIKTSIIDKIRAEVCQTCEKKFKCLPSSLGEDIKRTLEIAISKGRLNVVDLPKSLTINCPSAEKMTDEINYSVSVYEQKLAKAAAIESGRELVRCQSEGLAEVLKNLALDFGKQSEYDFKAEKLVYEKLIECGIYAPEVTVLYGDEPEIDVATSPSAAQKPYFLKAVSEAIGAKTVISDKINLSAELSAFTLKKAPIFDAAFGISQRTKDGEIYSGDTHSISKISEGKFLVALSDGMGSGKEAMTTSSAAISLIESFYRAGLPSKTILTTVNKLLSFSKEDDFTAIDIGVVNLYDGSADFIKVGSPYSFIITKDAVKIIEGNSLPLGILDEMKPTVCKTTLSAGDMIVFMSDGVADAFGSASDIIEFLSAQKALNPKVLSDDLLSKAMILNGGKASDDMTAFCVRIFDKNSLTQIERNVA